MPAVAKVNSDVQQAISERTRSTRRFCGLRRRVSRRGRRGARAAHARPATERRGSALADCVRTASYRDRSSGVRDHTGRRHGGGAAGPPSSGAPDVARSGARAGTQLSSTRHELHSLSQQMGELAVAVVPWVGEVRMIGGERPLVPSFKDPRASPAGCSKSTTSVSPRSGRTSTKMHRAMSQSSPDLVGGCPARRRRVVDGHAHGPSKTEAAPALSGWWRKAAWRKALVRLAASSASTRVPLSVASFAASFLRSGALV